MLNLLSEIESINSELKVALICLTVCVIGSCGADIGSIPNAGANSVPTMSPPVEHDQALGPRVAEISRLHFERRCREFFTAFPNSFEDLENLYGFDDVEGGRPLFSEAAKHFEYFFQCDEVTENERLEKAILISLNGKWQADSIWMFRERVLAMVRQYPGNAEEMLNNMSASQAGSFWYFMLDAPHPEDEGIEKRYKSLLAVMGQDSQQSKLIEDQYSKLITTKRH